MATAKAKNVPSQSRTNVVGTTIKTGVVLWEETIPLQPKTAGGTKRDMTKAFIDLGGGDVMTVTDFNPNHKYGEGEMVRLLIQEREQEFDNGSRLHYNVLGKK